MPLVKINLIKGKTTEYKNNISDAIHKSLVETANVPLKDKFQLINEYDENNFIFDAEYSNANRTNNLIIIEIILNSGRTLEVKRICLTQSQQILISQSAFQKMMF